MPHPYQHGRQAPGVVSTAMGPLIDYGADDDFVYRQRYFAIKNLVYALEDENNMLALKLAQITTRCRNIEITRRRAERDPAFAPIPSILPFKPGPPRPAAVATAEDGRPTVEVARVEREAERNAEVVVEQPRAGREYSEESVDPLEAEVDAMERSRPPQEEEKDRAKSELPPWRQDEPRSDETPEKAADSVQVATPAKVNTFAAPHAAPNDEEMEVDDY